MKQMNYFLAICLIVLASGCAFDRHVVLQTAVGPAPLVPGSRSPEGGLTVYSALDLGTPGEPDNVYYHSGYKIYSLDGKMVKDVNNKVGPTYIEDPATVSLPPGRYNVVARAAAFGTVSVPVVIEAGKTTSVHLDGSELTSGRQTSASDFVRLPDGLIIGWRAKENGEPK